MKRVIAIMVVLVAGLAMMAGGAQALPIMDGFTAYTTIEAKVFWQVYAPGDVASPKFSATDYSYIYQIQHYDHSTPGLDNITQFNVSNPFGAIITSSGCQTPGDIACSSVTPSPFGVTYDFLYPNDIPPLKSSYTLYLTSPRSPGMVEGPLQ